MKSLAELKAIRDNLGKHSPPFNQAATTRIIVAMGTCGIAAGARSVLLAIMDELSARNLQHVVVTQTGCMGMCEKEPLVEIDNNGHKTIYAYVDSSKAKRIVLEHVVNGAPINEWVVTNS